MQQYTDDLLDFADDYESYDDLFGEESADAFDPQPPPRGTTQVPHFPPDGHTLSAAQRTILNGVVRAIIARMPTSRQFVHCAIVDVEGHEDETGDPAQFKVLGQRRAMAAALFLAQRLQDEINKMPVADRRSVEIHTSSAGPTRPVRSNVTERGRSFNRRVEVRFRVDTCPNVA